MKELNDIIDQLEVVSYDDCTKELSASENALVIIGNVQKLDGSEDCIIVSPLNDCKRKFQFEIKDIERIEKIENQVFKVFVKNDSGCMVMSSARTKKSNPRIKKRKKFDFGKMKIHSYKSGMVCINECDICDSCDIYCDSCVVPCYDCYCDCDSCICDCDYVA